MTYPDLAEVLQARIFADLAAEKLAPMPRNRPDLHEHRRIGTLEAHIAVLEESIAKPEALGERRQREAETAAKRIKALDAHIAVLEEAVAKAEVQGEQQRQKAETAAKRTDYLVAELIEMTNELIEMSKRMAEQMAATDRMRAELDAYRSESCGSNVWQDDPAG